MYGMIPSIFYETTDFIAEDEFQIDFPADYYDPSTIDAPLDNYAPIEYGMDISQFVLPRTHLMKFGFPTKVFDQVHVAPNEYQKDMKLYYPKGDRARVCTQCHFTFFVEPNGFQKLSQTPVCEDSEGQSYHYHIHVQEPEENLEKFEEAPEEDQWNCDASNKIYAIDVEQVYTGYGQAVGRVTVVDCNGEPVLDTIVRPKDVIYDFVTKYSGLTPEHMEYATDTLETAREKIFQLINRQSILVGHGLNGDLKALGILHSKCIDTSILFMKNGRRPSLRSLVSTHLGYVIQASSEGHCSQEDAQASLDLVYFAAANPYEVTFLI